MPNLKKWVKTKTQNIGTPFLKRAMNTVFINSLHAMNNIVEELGSLEKAKKDLKYNTIKKECNELIKEFGKIEFLEDDEYESKFQKPDEIVLDDIQKENIRREKKKDSILDMMVQTNLNNRLI